MVTAAIVDFTLITITYAIIDRSAWNLIYGFGTTCPAEILQNLMYETEIMMATAAILDFIHIAITEAIIDRPS